MPRLVCPILILNIVSTSIFSPLGKVIGVVRLQTSFILSSWSWDSSPTGCAGRIKLSSVVHICCRLVDSLRADSTLVLPDDTRAECA